MPGSGRKALSSHRRSGSPTRRASTTMAASAALASERRPKKFSDCQDLEIISPSSPNRSRSFARAIISTPGMSGETVRSSIAPSSAAVSSSTARSNRSRARARTTLHLLTRPRLLDSRSAISERSAASTSSSGGSWPAGGGPIASRSACCSSATAAASSRAAAAASSMILMLSRRAASLSPTMVRSRRSALMLSRVWFQRWVS
jgi:hypothetical protein